MVAPPAWKRAVASCLAASLVLVVFPVLASDAPAGVVGEILAMDGQYPMAGSRVHLADPTGGRQFTSDPTAADGSFRVPDVPAGTYRVGIESEGRLYIVDGPLALAPGETRNVQLALQSKTAPAPAGVWQDPLYAGLIVAGSAIVLGILINEATTKRNDPVTQTED